MPGSRYLVGVGIAGPGGGNEMGSVNEGGGGGGGGIGNGNEGGGLGGGDGGIGIGTGEGDAGGISGDGSAGDADCAVLYDKGVEDLVGVSGICIFIGSRG